MNLVSANPLNQVVRVEDLIKDITPEEYQEVIDSCLDNDTLEQLARIREQGTAKNTRKALESDIRYFAAWLYLDRGLILMSHKRPSGHEQKDNRQYLPVPAEALIKFTANHLEGLPPKIDEQLVRWGIKAERGTHKPTTVERRIASLSSLHQVHGFTYSENPCNHPQVRGTIKLARKGISKKKARPILKDMLDKIVGNCDESIAGIRDKAIILCAYMSGGRRRSEIVAARVEDLERRGDDFELSIPRSKTDQEGKGFYVPISGRAAIALKEWLKILKEHEITYGPVFRNISRHGAIGESLTDSGFADILMRHIKNAGLDKDELKEFSAHSLRSGFVTQAGIDGYNLQDIMGMTLHKSVQTLMGYHQRGSNMNNPARLVGDKMNS